MRNPNRISETLKELEIYWNANPDWRLGQVISNLSYELSGSNDPFFIEDDWLLNILRSKNERI